MLAHERFGTGEPLVLIHGVTHRRQAWYPVVEQLAEEREVILLDLPGHGESPALEPDGRPITEQLLAEVGDLLAELGLDRPHMAGNSLGGRIALEAAAQGLARSATGLSPAGFWRSERDFLLVRAHFAALLTTARAARPLAPILARSPLARTVMLASLMTHGGRGDAQSFLGDLDGMIAARHALRVIIGGAGPFDAVIEPDVPVTIAWGTKDRLLLPYQAERARRQLPHAEHVWLEGSGHVPMSDDVDGVVEVLLRGSSQEWRRPGPLQHGPGRQLA